MEGQDNEIGIRENTKSLTRIKKGWLLTVTVNVEGSEPEEVTVYTEKHPLKCDYGELVSALVRSRYPDDAMIAIVNNYMAEPDEESYLDEWKNMQAWRRASKNAARLVLSEDE